ncbi:MAG: ABC transporter ATP-binding protein [Desulfurococcaceae archaeon]
MVRVSIKDLWMSFGKSVVLKGVNLNIEDGEFVTILGPSGCGKTTLLRIVAGLYKPVRGDVFFDERRVTDVPPWERNVGLVFQDYALWPHMTVYDNIAYGLKLRKVKENEISERVKYAASVLGIEDLLNRYPYQLSGGQQQRVALARAIVINPSVLLLDEPLSNLDAKIRVNVRTEIRRLQKSLKITTIYVTHDQEEALVISDRIAVMNMGIVEQVGAPAELYQNPKSLFVADFIGQVNIIPGEVVSADLEKKVLYVETEIGRVPVIMDESLREGDEVYLIFRPENVEVAKGDITVGEQDVVLVGRVEDVQFLGNLLRINVRVGDTVVKAEIHNPVNVNFTLNDQVRLKISAQHVRPLRK